MGGWVIFLKGNLDGNRCSSVLCSLLTQPFLANDVTLVTSYGYCQSLKINDRRLDRRCTYVRCLSYDL